MRRIPTTSAAAIEEANEKRMKKKCEGEKWQKVKEKKSKKKNKIKNRKEKYIFPLTQIHSYRELFKVWVLYDDGVQCGNGMGTMNKCR